MKHHRKMFIILFGLVLLTSCGPVTPIPPATATLSPSATPTLTATLTLTATQTPVFPLPTMQPYFGETPTPIATPPLDAGNFRLQKLDKARLAEMVTWMQRYSI
ncbi:MAG: hypothetical protein R6W69_01090, partial [Anaerolineales bacterium]